MNAAKEFVENTLFCEFPDHLVTLELCRAFAMRDGRKVGMSLRKCASILVKKTENPSLRGLMAQMAKSQFPEVQINQLRSCIAKMEKDLARVASAQGLDLKKMAEEEKNAKKG